MIEEITLIQTLVLCVAFAQVVFEYLLKRANERHLIEMRGQPPPETDGLMDSETWTKATDYSLAKSRFASFEDAFGFVLFVGVFLYLFPFVFSEWKADVSQEASPWLCAFLVTVFLTVLQIPNLFSIGESSFPGRKIRLQQVDQRSLGCRQDKRNDSGIWLLFAFARPDDISLS